MRTNLVRLLAALLASLLLPTLIFAQRGQQPPSPTQNLPFDSHDFSAIGHRNYARVLRELSALQHRLYDCTKFEKLLRYRCANLFFLVLTNEVYRESEIPIGWGALVESNESLRLMRKPTWHEITEQNCRRLLHRIAAAGTRSLNRQLGITFEDVLTERSHSL